MKKQILFGINDACYAALSSCKPRERAFMMRAIKLES
jgi:hypothetical protein